VNAVNAEDAVDDRDAVKWRNRLGRWGASRRATGKGAWTMGN